MLALRDGDVVKAILYEEGKLVYLELCWKPDGELGAGVLTSDTPARRTASGSTPSQPMRSELGPRPEP
jgi:hypothetical protein